MSNINLNEAQSQLPEIIAGLNPGEQIVITSSGEPLATLTRTGPNRWPCQAGSAKDKILWMDPGFDAPLEDFREYSE